MARQAVRQAVRRGSAAGQVKRESYVRISGTRGPFGATVGGLGPLDGLSGAALKELTDALYEHRFLVIPGQQGLSAAEFVRFGRLWGDPIAPAKVTRHRHPDFPEIIRMTNSPRTPRASRDGAMHWHSDSVYEAVPASVTLLHGVEAPPSGNDTLFADCVAAYEALPAGMKGRLDGLEVLHDPSGGKVDLAGEVRGAGSTKPGPVVSHPLVLRHPVTGRRSLFAFSATAVGIAGWAERAALDLLFEVKRHVLRPEFRHAARAGAGTVLIWDNHSVIHSATRTVYSAADGERRLINRISTRGLPVPYRAGAHGSREPATGVTEV